MWRGRIISFLYSGPRLFDRICTIVKSSCTKAPTARVPMPRQRVFKAVLPAQFDPTMLQLQQFINNLAVLMGNSIYTNLIQPALQSVLTSNPLSPGLSAFLQNIANLIATAGADIVVATLDEVLATGDAAIKALIAWLMSGANQSDLVAKLQQDPTNSYSSDFLQSFVAAVCDPNWLAGTSGLSLALPQGASHLLFRRFYKKFFSKLSTIS